MHTYRFLFSDAMKAEGFTRVTWEIEKVAAGFSRLTVIHELEGAPIMAQVASNSPSAGRRRLGLDSQRSEVAARDRQLAAGG